MSRFKEELAVAGLREIGDQYAANLSSVFALVAVAATTPNPELRRKLIEGAHKGMELINADFDYRTTRILKAKTASEAHCALMNDATGKANNIVVGLKEMMGELQKGMKQRPAG